MEEIKKLYTVFSLDEAVSGISNSGVEYDNYSFTISRSYMGAFKNEADCYDYIENILKDYRKRNVGKNTRFIVLPVFCFDNDEIFKL